jgi:xylulokinase
VGHPKLISYPYPLDPLWLSQAGTNACGASIDWASRIIGEAGGSPESFSRLAAGAAPGAGGVVYHPYLLGERCPHWDGALRGSFVGLGLGHGPEHLARAVLEGIAYSLRDAFGIFQEGEDRCEASTMTMVGGGAQSRILSQIICDVFGREIRVNPVADSAYGAALLALPALGASLSAPPEAPGAFLLAPDPEASDRYAEGFAGYRAITDRLREYYHRIPSIPDRPVDTSIG